MADFGTMQDAEDIQRVADDVRRVLQSGPRGILDPFDGARIDRKVDGEWFSATGLGFGIEIDGESYVICVEKV